MSDENIQYDVHDYEPVNKYIDDQSRLKRSASTWRYAKAATLIMVGVGILAVLLTWAYYLYKKPHRLVSLSEIEQKVLLNEKRVINHEKRLPLEEEINISTNSNILQGKINEKDLEISELKEQIDQTNSNDEILKNKLEAEKAKIEKEKLDLQKKLVEKKQVKTNVIHFKNIQTMINGNSVTVTTRLYYDDPSNLKANRANGSDPKDCYVVFSRDDLKKIELGSKNEQPVVSKYHLETLNVKFNDFINLKNDKCQF